MSQSEQVDQAMIDRLSNVIRKVDGAHSLGAGALAEAIIQHMAEWGPNLASEDADGQPDGYAAWYNGAFGWLPVDTSRDRYCETGWRAALRWATFKLGQRPG